MVSSSIQLLHSATIADHRTSCAELFWRADPAGSTGPTDPPLTCGCLGQPRFKYAVCMCKPPTFQGSLGPGGGAGQQVGIWWGRYNGVDGHYPTGGLGMCFAMPKVPSKLDKKVVNRVHPARGMPDLCETRGGQEEMLKEASYDFSLQYMSLAASSIPPYLVKVC
ncbi:hypothetical protein DSO57_1018129 [Entomophthora muscae]|uniref:Uncharacterized protein n=1 Tax=Entomophthora muscae TaxID=34485 RepID=A0ACC2T4F7_9FUNG|nr:hypothetical protein DSO57_1018129 [Entomophthora muscae]